MTDDKHKAGYYVNKDTRQPYCCGYNDTGKPWRFFDARWGPHGRALPGQWSCTNRAGLSQAMDDEEFQRTMEFVCGLDDPRVQRTYPDINDPDFLKPVKDMVEGEDKS